MNHNSITSIKLIDSTSIIIINGEPIEEFIENKFKKVFLVLLLSYLDIITN